MIISLIFMIGGFYLNSYLRKSLSESPNIKNKGPNLLREVLPRENPRSNSREIYYGKPGILSTKEMLEDLKVVVYPEDILETFPDPSFGFGSRITIFRATPIIVSDQGKEKIYRTFKKRVSEFLLEKNIILGEKDRIEPSLSTLLVPNLQIKITRVVEEEIREIVTLDFKTIKKEDKNLEKGKTYLERKGEKGQKEKIFKIIKENGKIVKKILKEERIIKKPLDEIRVYGTKVISYGEGWATWYNWLSGLAAAHRTLPLKTKVLVTNTKNGKSVIVTILDRGPFRNDALIDLTYEAFSQIGNPTLGKIWVKLEKAE